MTIDDPTPATCMPTQGGLVSGAALPPTSPAFSPSPPSPTQTPPGALASLICGILSVACCGMPVVGLTLGIIAIVSAGRARSAVQAMPARYLPSGLATGGLTTGIIGTVLGTLVILFWTTLILAIMAVVGAIGAAVGQSFPLALQPGPLL